MGNLIVGNTNLNDTIIVSKTLTAINKLIQNPSCYYSLKFKPGFYFEIPIGQITFESGWYIILQDNIPIYIGEADNLNNRLNTNNGSIDNFANNRRKSDDERNFIKKFAELKLLPSLRVCVVKEKDLYKEIDVTPSNLDTLDRGNIEKLINVFRFYFNYL